MILFLTSSPCLDGAGRPILSNANGFIDRIREALPEHPRCLFVASNPMDPHGTCEFGSHIFMAFADAGISFSGYQVLDARSAGFAAHLVAQSDFIVLAGGHVPTQNAFFNEIGLGALLQDFDGVVMGISAGTMNCAEIVYAQPEEEGESSPEFQRFLPGLGLTDINVCPHYQKVKDYTLDGQRLFEDITYTDSLGHEFIALRDGSYIIVDEDGALLFGQAYRIADGEIELINVEDETLPLE